MCTKAGAKEVIVSDVKTAMVHSMEEQAGESRGLMDHRHCQGRWWRYHLGYIGLTQIRILDAAEALGLTPWHDKFGMYMEHINYTILKSILVSDLKRKGRLVFSCFPCRGKFGCITWFLHTWKGSIIQVSKTPLFIIFL